MALSYGLREDDVSAVILPLMENGIQIMEMLSLEEWSQTDTNEFLFIALPLTIRAGTGTPIHPIVIA